MQEALRLDPGYGLAWAGVADAYALLGWSQAIPPAVARAKAGEASLNALRFAPELSEAHCCRAVTLFLCKWDWAGAEREFEEALTINPGNLQALAWLGVYYHGLLCNRFDLALTSVHLAQARDPLSAYATATIGAVESWSGGLPSALEWLDRTVALDPTSFVAQAFRQAVLSRLERWSESVAEGDALLARSGRSVLSLVYLGLTLARSGDVAAARSVYQELQGRTTRDGIMPSLSAALAALLGEDADVGGMLGDPSRAVARSDHGGFSDCWAPRAPGHSAAARRDGHHGVAGAGTWFKVGSCLVI